MGKKAVFFDMDGTLWDSVDNIAYSWNRALAILGIPDIEVTRERIFGFMGQTMDKFAQALLSDYPEARAMEILHFLEGIENDYLRENGAVLLGDVEGTFCRLRERGYFIGIVSNSQSGYIEAFLEHYHLEDVVDDILSYGDTGQGKAANIRRLMEKNALEQCWYVGDTDGDRKACRDAGVPFLWAAYGFGTVDADVPRVDSLEEIAAKLEEMDP